MFDISAIQIAIVLVIALLVFGPKKLPDMARTLGRGIRDFKSTMDGAAHDDDDDDDIPSSASETAGTDAAEVVAPEPPEEDDLAGMIVPGAQRPDTAA